MRKAPGVRGDADQFSGRARRVFIPRPGCRPLPQGRSRQSTISGLDELTSSASEGSARITCKFLLEREIESAAQDVREKVAGAIRNLPPNILPPIIQKADPDADPVISLVVASAKSA
jgi:hypothetical protein